MRDGWCRDESGRARRHPFCRAFTRWTLPAGLAAALLTLLPGGVHALGLELMPAGRRPAGRAGAVVAGADSPWALHHKPALMARLSGNQLVGAAHLHFAQRCMTRVQAMEPDALGGPREAGEVYPEVCAGGIGAVPQLAGSFQLAEGLVLGVGVYVPTGDLRRINYGEPGTLEMEHQGERIPTPTRWLLAEADLIQAFPTVGLAYEPHPAIRLGAAFGWGLTRVGFVSGAFARLADLETEARVEAVATDYFVPRVTLGAHVRPVEDVPFEMGLAFMWQDDVRTSSANLNVETQALGLDFRGDVDNAQVRLPLASHLTFGMRYFKPLPVAADDVGDRLSTERFDIEANVTVLFGRHVDAYVAVLPEDAELLVDGGAPGSGIALPDRFDLHRNWQTQVAVRVGGDYNPIPGRLGLRAGFTFESHGVQRGYEHIDFMPFRRFGAHAGLTVRVHRAFDLSLAYAHMFQPNVNVGVDEAAQRRAVGGTPREEDAILVNAGRFTARYHALMVEAAARF
jgi:hypothetical protein